MQRQTAQGSRKFRNGMGASPKQGSRWRSEWVHDPFRILGGFEQLSDRGKPRSSVPGYSNGRPGLSRVFRRSSFRHGKPPPILRRRIRRRVLPSRRLSPWTIVVGWALARHGKSSGKIRLDTPDPTREGRPSHPETRGRPMTLSSVTECVKRPSVIHRFLKVRRFSPSPSSPFPGCATGQVLTGSTAHGKDLRLRALPPIDLRTYLASGRFPSAVFENWESEFLQMAAYVV